MKALIKMKRIKLLIICQLMVFNYLLSQDVIITSDAFLNITPDATFVFANGGKLINNSTTDTLNGKFIFNGPDTTGIGGTQSSVFTTLSLGNSAFVNLSNNIKVGTELNLESGMLNLLNNNLTILDGAEIIGAFSDANMIIADGSGFFKREISDNIAYVFPVGDTTGIADYSPVNLTFGSGTFTDAVVSINLKNEKHAENSSVNDYINRYWTISQTGITGFSCDLVFNYTNEDIQGNEANMWGSKWDGSNWTTLNQASSNQFEGTVTDFSDFTAGDKTVLSIEDELSLEDIEIIWDQSNLVIRSDKNIKLQKAEVYSLLGQLVYSKKLDGSSATEISFNASSDLYIIKVYAENQFVSKKIFKK